MTAEQNHISRANVDALPVQDVFKLTQWLSSAINDKYVATDEASHLLMPIMDILDDSIMSRPASDLETLACKLLVAEGRTPTEDQDIRVCLGDARRILGEGRADA